MRTDDYGGAPTMRTSSGGTRAARAALHATLVLLVGSPAAAQLPQVELRANMVIERSVRIAPRTYQLPNTSTDAPVITIKGSNITVDFTGATLRGSSPGTDPDQRAGLAILIDGGSNVTLKNARVHGYKVGLIARGTRRLNLLDNDFSYNWKPRLFSLIEHESLVDWLSHHQNEKDEWLRFGAGLYLTDVRGGEVRGNRIEQGMEGLMMTRTDSMLVWNNVIQFNSGVGISLYRSSYNRIMHNHASFNVRGYSHGFYKRGQDSADLLLYEQSSHNIVAFNSMTHGGDGLFLWAGQSTMDTGQGGANDNLFYANDFSYAPTNAMEATFSRNWFIGNKARGSDHGLWGGYSFDSLVKDNDFGGNRIGIAIEHGQNNEITGNRFPGDSTAINLWARPTQPPDWGYAKHRDTRSRGYRIHNNEFNGNRVGLRIALTTDAEFGTNTLTRVDSPLVKVDTMTRLVDRYALASSTPALPVPLRGGLMPATNSASKGRDRSAIIVDEWGPYDYRTPKLWPLRNDPTRLRVLGPAGVWALVTARGATVPKRGRIGDTITVQPTHPNDWSITLQSGGRRFSYGHFQPIGEWDVQFFAWADSVMGAPLFSRKEAKLDYMWYRPTIPNLPQSKVGIVATSSVDLPTGEYTLRTISDDAIRVWVDGQLVIDNWKPHDSRVDNAPIAPGRHSLRVEHYNVDGWTELRVEIVRGVVRSIGSPGPH